MTRDASSFDPGTGRLSVTGAHLGAIARLASDAGEPEGATVEELRGGGIVVGDALHPRLVRFARCVALPSARLTAEYSGARIWAIDAWLDDDLAVLWRRPAASDGAGDAVVAPRGMIGLKLAQLIELGPRPRVKVDDPLEVDEGLVEALLGADEAWRGAAIESMLLEGDEVLPEWLEVLTDLSGQPKRRWRMGAWWNSTEESPEARSLEVVEADPGSFLLTRRRDPDRRYRRLRLDPLTSTQIWRLLCALVPTREQIDRPLDD